MNKKIKQYSALAVAAASILPMACKKDKTDNTTTDDPNITVRTLNLTVADSDPGLRDSHSDPTLRLNSPGSTETNIDIDNNGVVDFTAVVSYYKPDANNIELYSAFVDASSDSSNKVTCYFVLGDLPMARAKTTSQQMDASAPAYYAVYTGLYEKEDGAVIYNFQNEFKGQGDKYVGIKFKIGADIHYGWMKINLSADGKSLVIKDVAYDTRANTAITIGAR
ncbi:MAG: hypothetical protein U0U67_09930 [Chitinophagales bacterium]